MGCAWRCGAFPVTAPLTSRGRPEKLLKMNYEGRTSRHRLAAIPGDGRWGDTSSPSGAGRTPGGGGGSLAAEGRFYPLRPRSSADRRGRRQNPRPRFLQPGKPAQPDGRGRRGCFRRTGRQAGRAGGARTLRPGDKSATITDTDLSNGDDGTDQVQAETAVFSDAILFLGGAHGQ